MNIKGLNDTVRFSKTPFFNVCREFYNASTLNDKFKPFHIYLFRTDLLYDSIVKKQSLFYDDNEKYLTKTGKINYKKKTVRRYVEDCAQVYVGNTFMKSSKYKLKFCPIFISYRRMYDHDGFNQIISINGYSIDIGDSEDPYFATSEAKLLGQMPIENMKMPVQFAGDIRHSIEKLSELTKSELENLL